MPAAVCGISRAFESAGVCETGIGSYGGERPAAAPTGLYRRQPAVGHDMAVSPAAVGRRLRHLSIRNPDLQSILTGIRQVRGEAASAAISRCLAAVRILSARRNRRGSISPRSPGSTAATDGRTYTNIGTTKDAPYNKNSTTKLQVCHNKVSPSSFMCHPQRRSMYC